jgi:hypothetical protein
MVKTEGYLYISENAPHVFTDYVRLSHNDELEVL